MGHLSSTGSYRGGTPTFSPIRASSHRGAACGGVGWGPWGVGWGFDVVGGGVLTLYLTLHLTLSGLVWWEVREGVWVLLVWWLSCSLCVWWCGMGRGLEVAVSELVLGGWLFVCVAWWERAVVCALDTMGRGSRCAGFGGGERVVVQCVRWLALGVV
jgi:hypothetical protein